MKVSDVFQSRYLKKNDVPQEIICTIQKTALETVADDEEEKLVLYFRELKKAMVLNRTTSGALVGAYGDEMDSWPGRKVAVYADLGVQFKGATVGGLRLRPLKSAEPAKPKTKKPAAKAPAEDVEEFDDELP